MRSIAAIIVVAGLLLIGILFATNHLGLPRSKVWVGEKKLYPNGVREFSMLSTEETAKMLEKHAKDYEPYLTPPCIKSTDLQKCLIDTILSEFEKISRSKDVDLILIRRTVTFIASYGDDSNRRRALNYIETLPSPLNGDEDTRIFRLMRMVLHYSLGQEEEGDQLLNSFKDETKPFPFRDLPQYSAVNIVLELDKPEKAREIIERTSQWKLMMARQTVFPMFSRPWYGPVVILVKYYLKHDRPDEAEEVAKLALNEGSAYYTYDGFTQASAAIAEYYDQKGSAFSKQHERNCEKTFADKDTPGYKDPKSAKFHYEMLFRLLRKSRCWSQMKTLAGIILKEPMVQPRIAGDIDILDHLSKWDWKDHDKAFGVELHNLLNDDREITQKIIESESRIPSNEPDPKKAAVVRQQQVYSPDYSGLVKQCLKIRIANSKVYNAFTPLYCIPLQ